VVVLDEMPKGRQPIATCIARALNSATRVPVVRAEVESGRQVAGAVIDGATGHR
jgi:RecG-like helicase